MLVICITCMYIFYVLPVVLHAAQRLYINNCKDGVTADRQSLLHGQPTLVMSRVGDSMNSTCKTQNEQLKV